MPQKLNKAGKMQDYIPAGNGDPSGEYGTSKGTNKNFTASDKKSKANVITENKSIVVGDNKKSESKKDYTIKKESIYDKKNDKNFDYDVIDKLPDGWGKIDGALTAPKGYTWVNNKKSLWDKDYQQAIIKTELLETPNKANIIDGDLSGKKNIYDKEYPEAYGTTDIIKENKIKDAIKRESSFFDTKINNLEKAIKSNKDESLIKGWKRDIEVLKRQKKEKLDKIIDSIEKTGKY